MRGSGRGERGREGERKGERRKEREKMYNIIHKSVNRQRTGLLFGKINQLMRNKFIAELPFMYVE